MAEAKLIQKNMITRSPAKKKRHGFTRKCASLVQDQRARIYVFRRCATMLLCWYIQGDD
ncbi:DEVIL protein [Salix suchowensis]|nr:DEVIL protein [Salix suchowensis]